MQIYCKKDGEDTFTLLFESLCLRQLLNLVVWLKKITKGMSLRFNFIESTQYGFPHEMSYEDLLEFLNEIAGEKEEELAEEEG